MEIQLIKAMFYIKIITKFTLSIMETWEGYGLTGISILTPPIVYVNNGRTSDLMFDIVMVYNVQLYAKTVKVNFNYIGRKCSLNYNTKYIFVKFWKTISFKLTVYRRPVNGSHLKLKIKIDV